MSNTAWLNGLKKGDTALMYSSGAWGCPYDVVFIDKVNKASFTVSLKSNQKSTYRFNRETGDQVGGDVWHSKKLVEPTPELWSLIRAYAKRSTAIKLLKDMEDRVGKIVIKESLFDEIISHLAKAHELCVNATLQKDSN